MYEMIPFLQDHEKFQLSSILRLDTKCIGMVAFMLASLVWCIDSPMIQRIYMCSGPIQANKVFFYSGIFSICIKITIILIALFVFVGGGPDVAKTAVWPYIIAHIPPIFKGMVSISLLAMTMSTADSSLNNCAVMVSHDLLPTIQNMQLPHRSTWLPVRILAQILGATVHLLANIIPHSNPAAFGQIHFCSSGRIGYDACLLL